MENGPLMTRRKLLWTASLIAATCAVVALGAFLRPYWVAKYWGARADLRGTMRYRAPLREADLRRANLRSANLREADLRGSYLQYAILRGADLRDADLRDSALWGVDLMRANLQGANVHGAAYDLNTRWPEGFDPVAAGAVLVE